MAQPSSVQRHACFLLQVHPACLTLPCLWRLDITEMRRWRWKSQWVKGGGCKVGKLRDHTPDPTSLSLYQNDFPWRWAVSCIGNFHSFITFLSMEGNATRHWPWHTICLTHVWQHKSACFTSYLCLLCWSVSHASFHWASRHLVWDCILQHCLLSHLKFCHGKTGAGAGSTWVLLSMWDSDLPGKISVMRT